MAHRRPNQRLLVDLPFDVIETILEELTFEDKSIYIKDLSALSQTCKMMVPLARKHLFSTITLRDAECSRGFYKLISDNPTIILYPRKLAFAIPALDNINDDDVRIVEALAARSSGCLRSMHLTSRSARALDWNLFPDTLRRALEALPRMHTLNELVLSSIQNFPSALFSTFINLGSLTIDTATIMTPPELGSKNVKKVPAPWYLYVCDEDVGNSLDILISAGCIDFSNLVDVSFSIDTDYGIHTTMATFLQDVTQLKNLDVHTGYDINAFLGGGMLVGLGAIMAQAHKTLTAFSFETAIEGTEIGNAPLLGIITELGIIQGRNVLESIEIVAVVGWDFDISTLRDSNCPESFRDLDVLLTAPGAFPALKYVNIEIKLYGEEELEDDDFDHGSQIHFPRLVAQEGVEFIFSEKYIEIYCVL